MFFDTLAEKRGEILVRAIHDSNPQLCALVLRDGANTALQIEGTPGKTPLMLAAELRRTEIVRLLLAHSGINPDIRDNNNRSPLSHAVFHENAEIVELLLAIPQVDPTSCDIKGRSPLLLAAMCGRMGWPSHAYKKIVRMLLATGKYNAHINRGSHDGTTPLHAAAKIGHTEAVEMLLAVPDVDVDCRDNLNQSPLLLAMSAPHKAMDSTFLDLVRSGRVDGSVVGPRGQTPLHAAALHDRLHVVRGLLDQGVEPDPLDDALCTPLMLAVEGLPQYGGCLAARSVRTVWEDGVMVGCDPGEGVVEMLLATPRGGCRCIAGMRTGTAR
ncbi:ankyrin repeat domain-containing protein [Aspergillus mulundensis]|uniref:Uncharacterized protein n=1 Tax=Aspergillus mulundensis TaxID=1810919 RepID=A0A3D8SUI5_9EURO|nr:hypothetical protein DSM5745_01699 [Aspergillus mulundensis]RDW89924.1 hypothetical protein DSM5745_01699 [Aspergillus mulundensis]